MVLQGSPSDRPTEYQEFELVGGFLNQYKEDWRFYCKYYDQAMEHVRSYHGASNQKELEAANKAFWQFRETVKNSVPYVDNYSLEEVAVERRNYVITNALMEYALMFIAGFLLLQILRMSYVYVRVGKLVWHPFRG